MNCDAVLSVLLITEMKELGYILHIILYLMFITLNRINISFAQTSVCYSMYQKFGQLKPFPGYKLSSAV
jgi:hypothetical protein